MVPEKENVPRHLLRCPRCNKPLADIRGHLAYIRNNASETRIKVIHDAGGSFELSCSCGGQFIRTQKVLSMKYVIAGENTTVDK